MEQSIPALLIASIMIIGSVLVAAATNSSIGSVNESWREMEAISEERLGTDLTVVSTSVSGDSLEVTAVVANEGRTPLADFEHMDMIVNYEGTDAQRYIAWVPYSEDLPQPDNSWKLSGIANDYRNPGIVDTGEEATVVVKLSPGVQTGPERWLVFSTDTGVAYTVYF
jgi:archaellum component FlaF (FlaF/FlaG flagellin family)